MQVKLTSATPTVTVCAVTPTPSAADDEPPDVVVVDDVPLFAVLLHDASMMAPHTITTISMRYLPRTERTLLPRDEYRPSARDWLDRGSEALVTVLRGRGGAVAQLGAEVGFEGQDLRVAGICAAC